MKRKWKRPEPKNEREATDCIMAGIGYWLSVHPVKTLVVFGMIVAAPGYIALQYFTTDRISVKDAAPINEVFSFQPRAFAGGGFPIVINGKTYGYADTSVSCWKLIGEDTYLIHNHLTGEVRRIDTPRMFKK
jgi:hypothetical protein